MRFSGAATLVHDPEALALPTRADLVTAPDDTCIATSDAAGRWRVHHYQRADGTPLATGAQVLGANGSVRLPAALIVQWGLVTAADADVAVAFGTAFPGAASGSGRSRSPAPARALRRAGQRRGGRRVSRSAPSRDGRFGGGRRVGADLLARAGA